MIINLIETEGKRRKKRKKKNQKTKQTNFNNTSYFENNRVLIFSFDHNYVSNIRL